MADDQELLFAALKRTDGKLAKEILYHHPELTNLRRYDEYEQEESTPLIEACRHNVYGVVKLLLANGADVSATGIIHDHCRTGNLRVIKTLDMRSSETQFGALDDVFPLFAVCAFAYEKEDRLIRALLSAGADVNQRTAIGQTTLHVACTRTERGFMGGDFSLDDDDDFASNVTRIASMKMLIDHGADVNVCDLLGKAPLHYAAENGNRYFAKILLQNGADVNLKDKAGLNVLDYAATRDKQLTLALIRKYSFPMEQIIQAYECVGLHFPYGNPWCSLDSELLAKATRLREKYGIPKTVLPPLACYRFEREWQTIEELDRYEGSFYQLLLQCLLARERISIDLQFDVVPKKSPEDLHSRGRGSQDTNFNSLMRHWLDRISYFGKYLHFADLMINGGISLGGAISRNYSLSNDVLVKFVQVAIDSCCVIQNRLDTERKPGCVQELIGTMEQTLLIIRGVILHLIKRSDRNVHPEHKKENQVEIKNEVNPRIAKVLLDELLHRCPTVSSPINGCSSPVINAIFKAKYKETLYKQLIQQCFRHNYQLVKMITESRQCDLNATDCDGNTVLHLVIFDFLHEIGSQHGSQFHQEIADEIMATSMEIVQILLERGSYPHAKNKQGRCPGEMLQHRFDNSEPENYLAHFKDLLMKYDSSLSLKYSAARKIVDAKIPYTNQLPQDLVKFVDLH